MTVMGLVVTEHIWPAVEVGASNLVVPSNKSVVVVKPNEECERTNLQVETAFNASGKKSIFLIL